MKEFYYYLRKKVKTHVPIDKLVVAEIFAQDSCTDQDFLVIYCNETVEDFSNIQLV